MPGGRVLPEVGMAATVRHYAVREAATISAVADGGRRVTVVAEDSGETLEFSLRANGRFIRVGEDANGGTRLIVGRIST
ncbi:MAG TPA: hypothetical protein VGN69_07520 [Solirubrobacteraceae bacterium]|jgi:hypothetical protein|nr:hypothetical protein [Solirubrobacteraceae bacterium]